MKKTILLVLIGMILLPFVVKADGIPYPPIRPYISEEHQIVLAELKDDKIITTLDLGIRNKPSNVFPVLEDYVYINENNPVWLKTFLLDEDFKPEKLCVGSYDFTYRYDEERNKPLMKVGINDHTVYLYTSSSVNLAEEKIISRIPSYPREYGETYCQFISNQNLSDPQFVDVSGFFEPGEYNTINIRSNIQYRGFQITRVFLESGETNNMIKIIIPFKELPNSIEMGGQGINIWELENVFRDRKVWYGYYEDRLLSAKDAPKIAGMARGVENRAIEGVSITQVSSDVNGGFEGKVSDHVSGVSLASASNEYVVIRLADGSYESYLNDKAYVIELNATPYELKRIVIRWEQDVGEKDSFQYYYPLGTGQTWSDEISYTTVYMKMPKKFALRSANIAGREEAVQGGYRYYRWKFVESNPDEDLVVSGGTLSSVEEWFYSVALWLENHKTVIVIVAVLVVLGGIITVRSKPVRKGI